MTQFLTPSPAVVKSVAASLAAGDVVVLPTETVYGLGADATNDQAVARIYEIKGRPDFNPLIAHVSSLDMARRYAEVSQMAALLAETFWPGPLTLVLPLKPDSGIAGAVTAGLSTIGLRMPRQDTSLKIIAALDRPVAAPSANASGRLSPTKPEHVLASLGDQVEQIVIGGKTIVGLESTILDLTSDIPVILRAGYITREDIEKLIGPVKDAAGENEDSAPKSPGRLLKHYAPKTPLRLEAVDVGPNEALLGFSSVKFMGKSDGGWARDLPRGWYLNLSETGDLGEAAANLFSMLHELDRVGAAQIAVMKIPETGIGMALNDRLRRAAKA
jgi:L-threonylcarbamoyladenylate synthase